MKKLIVTFILLLSTFSAYGKGFDEQQKNDCIKLGGYVTQMGESQSDYCNIPTSDEGKKCYKKTDCQGECIVATDFRKFDKVSRVGKCSGTISSYGLNGFIKLDENGQIVTEPIE
jgi:hypothetical protein